MALFAFEALKISSYAATRAPNVEVTTQLALMLTFYGAGVFTPRLCWQTAALVMNGEKSDWKGVFLWVAGLGFLLSVVHLLFLAFILRIMYSPPGWGLSHLLHSLGEVWLGNAGMWLMVYAVVASAILYVLSEKPLCDSSPTRYEIRENGKVLSIPITDIYWIKAAGNYVELHTERGITMARKTLSQIEKEIGASILFKSHRSALVNGRHVLAIKPLDRGGGFIVQLSNDEEAPLSRRRLSAFKEFLKTVD